MRHYVPSSTTKINHFLKCFLFLFSLLLTACGGGGEGDGNDNSAPVAVDSDFSVLPGESSNQVLSASDIDGDTLTFSVVTPPVNGTLILNNISTGEYTYTLDSNASGDTFTFWVNDGLLDSNISTVTITGTIPESPSVNIQAAPGDQRVTLNWDTVIGAESYNVYWSTVSGTGVAGTLIPNVTPPFYHDTLINGQDYYYVITSVNAVGESTASIEVSTTPVGVLLSSLSFPDTNLSACITTATTGMTYVHELTNLYCQNMGISNLDGIEALTGLNILLLDRNNIADIAKLSSLTLLTRLDLYNNNISNISTLSGLTGLTNLALSNNNISDVSMLANMNELIFLYLRGNAINDISPLTGLINLTFLELAHNDIVDISTLSGLTKLSNLNLSFNSINDISALSGLTELMLLWLNNNTISDISVLSGLNKLTHLYLASNNISDTTALAGLTTLTQLYIDNNNINDVTDLSNLTGLTYLSLINSNIGGQGIGNIDTLVSLTSATSIYLVGNIDISCAELTTLVSTLGSPPVNTDYSNLTYDSAVDGVNCTNP